MTKYRVIPLIFFSLLSLFVVGSSFKMEVGAFNEPGPGFVPLLLGLALLATSLFPILNFILKKKKTKGVPAEAQKPVDYRKMGFVLISLLGYTFLLEGLGFVATTSIFLILLLRGMGNRWTVVFIGTAITAAVTYFLFTSLGVRFPGGTWW